MTLFESAHLRSTELPTGTTRPLFICAMLLFAIGTAARLSPLFDAEHRLFWQYMTEDGYLMQTVARNMAIGLGMSTAEGTMATNGVQPLATFVFAAMHALAGGSKFAGIALVTAVSALAAAAGAWFFFRVTLQVFGGLRLARELAPLAAGLWYAAPQIVAHSMNGLETGIYYLAILAALDHYLRISGQSAPLDWRRRIALGVLLGVAFLARNDAVFFIGGLLFAHLALGGAQAGGGYGRRFADCLVAGVTSIVVASPWLIHNRLFFGSIVPISGTAQSHKAALGQNLPYIPANLFENTFLYAPIPRALETRLPVMIAALLAVAIVLILFWPVVKRGTLETKRFYLAGLLFGAAVTGYYGLFFGAPHFIPRYMSPLSVFLWPAAFAAGILLLNSVLRSAKILKRVMPAAAAAFVAMASWFGWSDFAEGRSHMHKQVVDWVAAHVPPKQWVGAVQTGTLGYFHDRTINLDGKVNPDALREMLKKGHVIDYILGSRIDYVVDWAGVTGWVEDGKFPQFTQAFEVAVKDRRLNLAVLRRKQPVPAN